MILCYEFDKRMKPLITKPREDWYRLDEFYRTKYEYPLGPDETYKQLAPEVLSQWQT